MTARPMLLQTLPPDGTVLEELIGAMQNEYGAPATPQEYRLIIKTPVPEEPTDPSLEVKTAVPTPPNSDEEPPAPRQRTARRRRRSRRRVPEATGDPAVQLDLDDEELDEDPVEKESPAVKPALKSHDSAV